MMLARSLGENGFAALPHLEDNMAQKNREWEDSEAQWSALLGEDLSVSPENVEKYLAHLNEHLTFPCEATGIEDFPWEEKLSSGAGTRWSTNA